MLSHEERLERAGKAGYEYDRNGYVLDWEQLLDSDQEVYQDAAQSIVAAYLGNEPLYRDLCGCAELPASLRKVWPVSNA